MEYDVLFYFSKFFYVNCDLVTIQKLSIVINFKVVSKSQFKNTVNNRTIMNESFALLLPIKLENGISR